MIRIPGCIRTDREGQTLAVVVVMMVALLGLMAIAIDLGMAHTARVEAQRAADAAALAGASVFMEYPLPADYEEQIHRRAREYAALNSVRNMAVASGFRQVGPVERDGNEVTVDIIDAENKVRVRVRREGIATWMARFLGIDNITVSAMAAAAVGTAGAVDCVKPWVVMDAFLRNEPGANETLVPADDEGWDEDIHWYEPSRAECDGATSGYGSDTDRGRCDFGHTIVLHSSNPSDAPLPGFFWPVRLSSDRQGANDYKEDIKECSDIPIEIGDRLRTENGNMPIPTSQAVNDLIRHDVTRWDPNADGGKGGPVGGAGWDSPRFVTIALVGPDEIAGMNPSDKYVTVTNFGRFFLEDVQGRVPNQTIQGRFLYYVDGIGDGTTQSSLIRMLRLVE
jgi:hypothetical protein